PRPTWPPPARRSAGCGGRSRAADPPPRHRPVTAWEPIPPASAARVGPGDPGGRTMGELSGWRGLGGRGVAVGSLAASAVIVAAGAVARGPAHPARPAPPTQDRVVASLASGRRPALEPAGPRRAG